MIDDKHNTGRSCATCDKEMAIMHYDDTKIGVELTTVCGCDEGLYNTIEYQNTGRVQNNCTWCRKPLSMYVADYMPPQKRFHIEFFCKNNECKHLGRRKHISFLNDGFF